MSVMKKCLLPGVMMVVMSVFSSAYAAPEPSVIHVTGYAEQEVVPDTAFVTLGMETVSANANEARMLNTEVMNRLTHLLLQLGIAYQDMQSVGFSLQPRYDQNGKRIVQYLATNNLKVRVRDLKQLPLVLDKASESGTNTVRNLQFACADTSTLKAGLLKEAVTNGRRAAEAAASAAGSILGKAKEININGFAPTFKNVNLSAMKAMSRNDTMEAPELQAGVQKVSETVDMTFYLE